MKLCLPLIASAIFLTNCTTAYQTGQTPDDVYYSPERQRNEYVRVEEKDDQQYSNQLASEEQLREDRYLRMKTSYRRYNTLDDYDCYCYSVGSYNRYYDFYRYNNWNYYNPTFGWNNRSWNVYTSYYYNPYYNQPYYSGYVLGSVTPVYNKPRKGNLAIYNGEGGNHNPNVSVPYGKGTTSRSSESDNYRGSGSSAGSFLRNVFSNGSTNNNSSSGSSTKTSSSSSSSSNSNSSSSSGTRSAPARRF